MPRAAVLGSPQPYTPLGVFAGLTFWAGGLTLLAAAPGTGKTSWLLRMLFEAAAAGLPAALGCYEHSAEELKYRLARQSEAAAAGPHAPARPEKAAALLAAAGELALLPLSEQHDTVRALEEALLVDYGFPEQGPALLAVDYLNRIPVLGLSGMLPEAQRSGAGAAELRDLSRRRGWAVVAAAALRAGQFDAQAALSALLGDERVAYVADRVLLARRDGPVRPCGCVPLAVHTLKDRTGPARSWQVDFWGERFYPALESERARHA